MVSLEDDFSDIISKARRGLGFSMNDLARMSGLRPKQIESLETAQRSPSKSEAWELADSLELDADKLSQIAQHAWGPAPCPEQLTPAVIQLNGSIHGYEVHGYICYDPNSLEAALIDTAYDPTLALDAITRYGLTLSKVLLTHCHYDHAGGLETLRQSTGAKVVLHSKELPLFQQHSRTAPDQFIEDGEIVSFGHMSFIAHSTPGHTPGGMSYQVGSTVFVGDTLFAGSTGRSMSPEGYRMLLTSLREKILSLPAETRLFPGHGPATTVGEEQSHNPFFKMDS